MLSWILDMDNVCESLVFFQNVTLLHFRSIVSRFFYTHALISGIRTMKQFSRNSLHYAFKFKWNLDKNGNSKTVLLNFTHFEYQTKVCQE